MTDLRFGHRAALPHLRLLARAPHPRPDRALRHRGRPGDAGSDRRPVIAALLAQTVSGPRRVVDFVPPLSARAAPESTIRRTDMRRSSRGRGSVDWAGADHAGRPRGVDPLLD